MNLDVAEPASVLRRPPPRVAVLAGLAEITCTPAQHIWLRVPTSWRCQCGELIIVDGPASLNGTLLLDAVGQPSSDTSAEIPRAKPSSSSS